MPKIKKEISFSAKLEEFKEKDNQGCFEGILVNYEHKKLAHGWYKFEAGSMKENEGKTMLLLYNHAGSKIPVGTCTGKETDKGFLIEAQLQLSTDQNGNTINLNAASLYDLMKNQGAKFELSAGGIIEEGESKEITENGKTVYCYMIKKFNAYEGSITPRAAVEGSKITNIFTEGEEKMNKEEMKQFFEEFFKGFRTEMFSAKTEEELKELPIKFEAMQTQFKEMKTSLQKEVVEKYEKEFTALNDVIKGLRADFKATEKERTDAEEFKAMLDIVMAKGVGVSTYFNANETIQFAAEPATTTGNGTSVTVRPQYAEKLLERLQETNPVLADINFITTTENSYFIPREMLGLPETGWVGETATREETEKTKIDSVTINLYQLYAMPVISNRLLATNFIGYANFLLKRVEYALSLKLANSIFAGDGVNQPKGIFKDDTVTQKAELDTSDDEALAASIITAYYSVRSEIAENSKWYMTRLSWGRISKIKSKDGRFYVTDLNKGSVRELMGRPVVIIESDNTGMKDIDKATAATDPVGVFANLGMAMLGLVNPNLDLHIQDQITSKGLTKLYQEKLIGVGVQLPEYITKLIIKAAA